MSKEENTSKRISKLEKEVATLTANLNALTNAIRQSAHIMGWPVDLLERQGIKAYDKKVEKLDVDRVGDATKIVA